MLKKDFAALRSHGLDDRGRKCLNTKDWALNSAVECHLHTVEVRGSNPLAPTIVSSTCRLFGFLRGSIWVQ